MDDFHTDRPGVWLVVREKFHAVDLCRIFDIDVSPSTLLHSISIEVLGPPHFLQNLQLLAAVAVADELLALVTWESRKKYKGKQIGCQAGFMRCKGFGSQKKELVWQRTKPLSFPVPAMAGNSNFQFLSCVQI